MDEQEKSITGKTLVVWVSVGKWILAVIPYIIFGAFFLSLFTGMMILFTTKKVSVAAIRNVMGSNFKAFAVTLLFFALVYIVFFA